MSEAAAHGLPATTCRRREPDRAPRGAHTGVRDATRDGTDAPAPGRERGRAQ